MSRIRAQSEPESLGVTHSVCVSDEPRLRAELISAAKEMRCIQCSLA